VWKKFHKWLVGGNLTLCLWQNCYGEKTTQLWMKQPLHQVLLVNRLSCYNSVTPAQFGWSHALPGPAHALLCIVPALQLVWHRFTWSSIYIWPSTCSTLSNSCSARSSTCFTFSRNCFTRSNTALFGWAPVLHGVALAPPSIASAPLSTVPVLKLFYHLFLLM
jgi:hypothetical protein